MEKRDISSYEHMPHADFRAISHQNGAFDPAFNEAEDFAEFARYFQILKRRWWIVALVPILVAALAYSLTLLRQPMYSASGSLLVNPALRPDNSPASSIEAATLVTQTYSALVKSPPVLGRVIKDLQLDTSTAELASQISVHTEPTSALIVITAKNRAPGAAATITNAIGDTFVTFVTDVQNTGISQNIKMLQDSIDAARTQRDSVAAQLAQLRSASGERTPEEKARIANLDSLREQYQNTYGSLLQLQQQLQIGQYAVLNRVRFVVRAEVPERPVQSFQLIVTAAAFLAALAITGAGVVMRDRARPRVRTAKDVLDVVALPTIGTIPRLRDALTSATSSTSRSFDEAIRSLWARIWIVTGGQKHAKIMVTSPTETNGTSTVAAKLALAFAQAGQRVILIDGNFRNPRQWDLFGKGADEYGLADLLSVTSQHAPTDLLVRTTHPNLRLLLAGPVDSKLTARLSGAQLAEIVHSLEHLAEIILIDAPNLVGVADALLFTPVAEYAVIVVEAGKTTSRALQGSLALLEESGVRPLGVALYGAQHERVAV